MFRERDTLVLRDWPVRVTPLLPGDAGVNQTLDLVTDYIKRGSIHPYIFQAAHYAARGCQPEKHQQIFDTTATWIRRHFHFFRDPKNNETVKAPWEQVRDILEPGGPGVASGDCDCLTALQGAIWANLGYKVRAHVFAIPKTGKVDQDAYNHVRAEAYIGGRWQFNDWIQPKTMKYVRDTVREV